MRNFNPRDFWRVSCETKQKPDPVPSPLEEFKPKAPEPSPAEAAEKRKMEDLVEPVQKKKRAKVRLPW